MLLVIRNSGFVLQWRWSTSTVWCSHCLFHCLKVFSFSLIRGQAVVIGHHTQILYLKYRFNNRGFFHVSETSAVNVRVFWQYVTVKAREPLSRHFSTMFNNQTDRNPLLYEVISVSLLTVCLLDLTAIQLQDLFYVIIHLTWKNYFSFLSISGPCCSTGNSITYNQRWD